MIIVEYRQIELDVCAACKGVWFDAEELELLLESLGLESAELGRPPAAKPAEAARKCPCCRARMAKVLMGPGEGVLIDRCKRGHGLWFDGGELDVVIRGLREPAPEGGEPETGKEIGSFLSDVLLAGDQPKKEGA